MFTVYKKIISPESSPVLGPAIAPKEALVNDGPTTNDGPTPSDRNNNNDKSASLEPFSLCNYCCSHRNNRNTKGKTEQEQMKDPTPMQEPECKYEFGHATHYTYRATTPRLLCEFETGTPVAP